MRFEIDQDHARALGGSSGEVALTLQTLLSGAPVTALREGNRLADVVVRATPEERAAVDRLGDITVATRSGASVPLSQIARETVIAREPILWRRNGEAVLSVRSDVVDGAQGPDMTAAILPRLAPLIAALPADYRITAGGAVEESAKANAALVQVLPVMFLIVLTLIMLQMRRFSRTILVFVTFPMGFIGGSFAL